MTAPTKVYQWLGPRSGTKKTDAVISPTPPIIVTGVKKCKTWPGFSTPVAFKAYCFEREQHIGNIKHALGAQADLLPDISITPSITFTGAENSVSWPRFSTLRRSIVKIEQQI